MQDKKEKEVQEKMEIVRIVKKILRKGKFSEQELQTAEEIANRFCLKGQMAIASFLMIAKNQDKFREALAILEEHWKIAWKSQPPEVRGDPNYDLASFASYKIACWKLNIPSIFVTGSKTTENIEFLLGIK